MELIEISSGTFVSEHSVTDTQASLDQAKKFPRWSRASWSNLVPAPHGKMELIEKFFPELNNDLIGRTIWATVSHTSYLTCSHNLIQPTEVDFVAADFQNTLINPKVLGIEHGPLVSSDYLIDGHSCVIDVTSLSIAAG